MMFTWLEMGNQLGGCFITQLREDEGLNEE